MIIVGARHEAPKDEGEPRPNIGYIGLVTLADAERVLSRVFGCKTKGVIIPDAGFGMDMDLPEL